MKRDQNQEHHWQAVTTLGLQSGCSLARPLPEKGKKRHLWLRPMLSRYSLEPLPSQMPTPFALSTLAFVLPLMNQSSSSTTPATNTTDYAWILLRFYPLPGHINGTLNEYNQTKYLWPQRYSLRRSQWYD